MTIEYYGEDHPERRQGEVFVGNVYIDTFMESSHKTKRLGGVCYCANGDVVPFYMRHGMRPMFVDKTELEAAKRKRSPT